MTVHDFDMARFIGGEVEEVYANATVMVDPESEKQVMLTQLLLLLNSRAVQSVLLITAVRLPMAMISVLKYSAQRVRLLLRMIRLQMFPLLMKTAIRPINRFISSLKDICSPLQMK